MPLGGDGKTEHDPHQHRRRDAAVVSRLRHERDHRARAARHPRRAEAGASAHSVRDVGDGAGVQPRLPQVRGHRRRSAGQLPSARRHAGLRRAGAHGAGFFAALSAGGWAGKFRFGGRRSAGGIPVHRSAAVAHRHGAAGGYRQGDRRFPAELRRTARGARSAADARSESADQRIVGHRGRHGDQHSAAQSHRDHQRHHFAGSESGHASERDRESGAGAGFPDRRIHSGPPGHSGLLHQGPRVAQAARQSRDGKVRQGSRGDRRHRDSVSGEQSPADRSDAPAW